MIAAKGYDNIAKHAVKQIPNIKNAITKIVNILKWQPKVNINDTIKKSLNDFIEEYKHE
jgi:nucleoside-diphosphate-sugar epimerase